MTAIAEFTRSFRARLIAGYALVALVFAVAWLWSLYGPLTGSVIAQQQRNLEAVARAGVELAQRSQIPPPALARTLAGESDLRVTIVAAGGTVLADSSADPATMENHGARPEVAAALNGETGSARRVSATEGNEQLYVAVPATVNGAPAALRVSQPLSAVVQIARSSRRVAALLLPLSVLAAAVIAAWASRAAAQPIQRLSASARSMASGNLSAPVPAVPPDLETLADSLSGLRTEVQSRIDALDAERTTLRTVLDGLDAAVFLLGNGSIRFANQAASRLFRAPVGGWEGHRFDGLGLPEAVTSTISDDAQFDARVQLELPTDPTGRTLRVSVVPLDTDGAARDILVVVEDVTERAKLDRVRRDFVTNASHELKTPVAGIRLLAQSAGTAADDGDLEQAIAFSRGIADESARLEHLVTDLLNLSRLDATEAGELVADVRQAAENAVIGHRGAAARKALSLELDLSAIKGQDVYVRVDPTDLAVAFDNLLSNATTYTMAGSVRLSVCADDEMVEVTVADTGLGIPAEDLPRIFERFYRVDRARSRASGGTGLGLALVKHVVERSHGTIEVRSELGVGSTFTLRLPRAT